MPVSPTASYDGYYNASPECWEIYMEVLGIEYANALIFGTVVQYSVDTYAVQHAGGQHPDKSVGIHLAGLYLMFEVGIHPGQIAILQKRLADNVQVWPRFVLDSVDWSVNVFDVALADSADDHKNMVCEWATAVWNAWAEQHNTIRTVIHNHLTYQDLSGFHST